MLRAPLQGDEVRLEKVLQNTNWPVAFLRMVLTHFKQLTWCLAAFPPVNGVRSAELCLDWLLRGKQIAPVRMPR